MSSISTNSADSCADSFSFKPSAVTPEVFESAIAGFATAKDLEDSDEKGDVLNDASDLMKAKGLFVGRMRER